MDDKEDLIPILFTYGEITILLEATEVLQRIVPAIPMGDRIFPEHALSDARRKLVDAWDREVRK